MRHPDLSGPFKQQTLQTTNLSNNKPFKLQTLQTSNFSNYEIPDYTWRWYGR